MVEKGWDSIHFRRTLYGDSLELWNHIKEGCANVVLTGQRDTIKWTLNKNNIYTVKSYYRHLVENGVKYPHNFMWKIKMPPRVKVFMWLVLRNSILTKDNLLRRGWAGDKKKVLSPFLKVLSSRLLWNVMSEPLIYKTYQIMVMICSMYSWKPLINKKKKLSSCWDFCYMLDNLEINKWCDFL